MPPRPILRRAPAPLRPLTTAPRRPPTLLPQVRNLSGPYGYTQSRALVCPEFGEPSSSLHLHTHSISPSLPPSTLLLRTLAAPINPSDVNTIQGTYGALPPLTTLLGTARPSFVPGNEGVFEVVSVGPGVKGFKKGDWAIPAATGLGTWRTHAVVGEGEVMRIAPGAGLEVSGVATVSVNPCSAWRMLRDYVDLVGESVKAYSRDPGTEGGAWFIQNGANSAVGRAAVQLGKLWGLRSINVVRERGTEEETARLKEEMVGLGATVVVTEGEFLERGFTERLKGEWTRGGRDRVLLGLNCVGGKSAAQVVRSLGEKGVMVTYGGMSRQSFPFPTGPMIFKRLRFEGFWLSAWAKEHPAEKKKTIEEIVELMRKGQFKSAPVEEVKWDWDTDEKTLKDAVQGTLGGFRSGKGLFVFGET